MERRDVYYFAWCASVVAASIAFVVPAFTAVGIFWYYPLRHAWTFETHPSAFAVDWYGRSLWALAAGALALGIVFATAPRLPKPSSRAYRLWATWALLAAVLAIAVYSYQLARRHPIPEPLPTWYVPR
jgi:hypothetical protein